MSRPNLDSDSKELAIDVFTGEIGTINFTISCENQFGTFNSSALIYVNITYNCNFNSLSRNPFSPSVQEANKNSYPNEITFIRGPILSSSPNFVFNTSAGVYKEMMFSLTDRVHSNASAHCKLSQYEITRIQDLDTGVILEANRYSMFVSLTESGSVLLKELSKTKNFAVFIKAFNSIKNITVPEPVLGVQVYMPVMKPPNSAPFLDGAFEFSQIQMTGNLKNKVHAIKIPEILDSNPTSVFEISISPKTPYAFLNLDKMQIEILLDKVPLSDMKF